MTVDFNELWRRLDSALESLIFAPAEMCVPTFDRDAAELSPPDSIQCRVHENSIMPRA